jgi:EAL domain-containing protein (putative c-di-GMP-specific phosphodiesterase class I)
MLPPLKKPFRANDLKERLAACGHDVRVSAKPAQASPARKGAKVQLWDALRNNWLELWYQPKVDLKTLTLCGAEALIRAHHPEHGIVTPEDLLPSAGDPNLLPMSKFVFRRAMVDWAVFADRAVPLKLADEVKIDRGFVIGCASDALKHGLCQTVIDLAHRFGATVWAEGIENVEDLRALMAIGCDTAQGFLFAKPMSFDQFLSMLVNRDESSMRFQAVASSARGPRLVQIA